MNLRVFNVLRKIANESAVQGPGIDARKRKRAQLEAERQAMRERKNPEIHEARTRAEIERAKAEVDEHRRKYRGLRYQARRQWQRAKLGRNPEDGKVNPTGGVGHVSIPNHGFNGGIDYGY